MNFHDNCIFCHSPELMDLTKYDSAYLTKCRSCNIIFSKRIPTQEELAGHYAHYQRGKSISELTLKRYDELLDSFEYYRKTSRILDIGCGDGHFLLRAKLRGWEVYGTEYTDDAIAVLEKTGITSIKGTSKDVKSPGAFDIVTEFEVLEHLNSGFEEYKTISSLLRKGGLFYFTTPNFNSLSRKILGKKWIVIEYPEHLTYYTPTSIHNTLVKSGFSKVKLESTGFSKREFNPNMREINMEKEENLRNKIEDRKLLSVLKKLINKTLSFTHTGDTIKGYYIKS
jgi:2-polyprenyl-3-methyl-5-hydroxy-6-metoxy-1,4-benzoquinol methylase